MEHRIAVGQLVRYVASETAPFPRRRYPAIVVHVEDHTTGIVNLTVFNDVTSTGAMSRLGIAYSGEHQAGTWHYPDVGPDAGGGINHEVEVDL